MRTGPGEQEYARFLLQMGSGQLPHKQNDPFQGTIEIPEVCVQRNDENIIDSIFSDGVDGINATNRVILSPTNDESLKINEEILERLPQQVRSYHSVDSVVSDDPEEINSYPLEFLNSLTPSGMPPHRLNLKEGCVVMLLQNMSVDQGLVNGTRLKVITLRENTLDCEVLTGENAGKRILLIKTIFEPKDTNLPFQLRRTQFPLRLSYAITINKSKGQTYEKVGISLKNFCFGHGQLYVAFSQTRSFGAVKAKIVETMSQGYLRGKCYTKNVVYQQVL